MTKLLIIDDEPGIRKTLAAILEDEGYQVLTAEDAVIALDILRREPVAALFLDVLLPNMGGIEALERIRGEWPEVEVIVMSGHANVNMAVRAVKLGAFDFLEKPLSLDKVLTSCRNALTVRRLREENRNLKQNAPSKDELIGSSEAIQRIRERIIQAAASDARLLITGENGTGKELAARAVHRHSRRAGRAFVEVNCAAIPDALLESELFGHEKGAFTDAVTCRRGRFELASGGTLFLDEIGDMSLSAQAKVLRVIQEQRIERVGGEKTIETDVRIVAATNKDLEQECDRGRFRRDLYFRLNVIPINLPSLRERKEDIPVLLLYFLKERDAGNIVLAEEAAQFLTAYSWPGNVRELKNLAERILVMYNGDRIGLETVRDLLQEKPGFSEKKSGISFPGEVKNSGPNTIFNLNYTEAKAAFEKQYLEFQLAGHDRSVARTAEAIGIYPSNLHAKLKKYHIRTER
ncbi:MAG: sigma-54 dependent transcriptional regulator [Treponema sp.]|jgi:two-component system nitrogen regulation response regulator NtrX|nr:sigma-54 dependent transcriptional regulator [Treponema sp.]